MFNLDQWQEIFYTIRQNKLRTFLTAFSVAWGIFMLILLLGAGSGLLNGVTYNFQNDATNSIWIRTGKTSLPYQGMQPGRRIELTNEDYETIRQTVPGVEHITAQFYVSGEKTVRRGDKYGSFNVRACHPDHMYLEKTAMVSGRYLNTLDMEEKRKVVAIGADVATTLFGNGDPLGQWIDVGGIPYKVVGTFKDEGQEGEAKVIYIPISTAQTAYSGGDEVNTIALTTGEATLEETQAMHTQIKNLLFDKYTIAPDDPSALRINNFYEAYQRVMSLFAGINIFIWAVGIGTIIAGIVGISNIMLIVVKERTKEIGVRKAIGATPASIIGLVLQESIVITLIAGYTGLLAGVGLVELISHGMDTLAIENNFFRNPQIDFRTAVTATILLVVAGAIAGFFPARKAAQVSPVEALQYE